MKKIAIRNILDLTKDQLWDLPEEEFILQFDDGELITDTAATVYSWYCMVFSRMYRDAPVYKHHHIGGGRLTTRTTAELIEHGLFGVKDHYDTVGKFFDLERASNDVYEIINEIHCDFNQRLAAYVTGICILDFINVVTHPVIAAANASTMPTQNSIDNTYSIVKKVLLDPTQLIGNPVAKAARSGLVSMGQILQCVSLRGYLTDINSRIFHSPVLRNYTQGIITLHDAMIESRSASKALWFTKDPVADSEYFNRKMQLGCANLKNIYYTDCGSTKTIAVAVTAANFDSLEGKNYMTEKGLVPIRRRHREVIGQTVQMRSVLKCRHPDPYGVCSACLGELSYSIPKGTVIGHMSAASLCEAVSQNVLSTKHLDGSSTIDDFIISDFDADYIRLGSEGHELKLTTKLKEADSVRMHIQVEYAPKLADLHRVKSVSTLPIDRVSEIVELVLEITANGMIDFVTIPVSMGSRCSYFTVDALNYIKNVGWENTTRGDYIIDLKDWDYEFVMFLLPMKHTNMVEYMTTIENFVKASPNKSKSRTKRIGAKSSRGYDTTEEALFAFYDLINSKLRVNIAHLEIILLSTMVTDAEKRDHRLPADRDSGEVGYYEDNMMFRSLSATMAYEKQGAVLSDVRTFIVDNRPNHTLDEMLIGDTSKMRKPRKYDQTVIDI